MCHLSSIAWPTVQNPAPMVMQMGGRLADGPKDPVNRRHSSTTHGALSWERTSDQVPKTETVASPSFVLPHYGEQREKSGLVGQQRGETLLARSK